MKKVNFKSIGISALLFVLLCSTLSGCINANYLKVKMGLKNNDFEYMNEGKVKKIIIQSTRDSGFKFEVTDQRTIDDIYDILSTAKSVSKKTDLQPDYTLELQESSTKSIKFSYIAGLDKRDYGNFYGNNKTYIVSKRIDDDMMKDFWDLGTPSDFNKIYYPSIFAALSTYAKDAKSKGNIGININDDVTMLRYVMSVDLYNFQNDLKSKAPNAKLLKNQNDSCDIQMDINTEGFITQVVNSKYTGLYKAIVTFLDVKQNIESKYYIVDEYKNNSWSIKVSKDKPSDF